MLMPCRYLRAAARLDTMTEASCSVYLAEDVMASNKSPPYAVTHKMMSDINSGRQNLSCFGMFNVP